MKFYIVENGYVTACGEDDSTAPDMPNAAEIEQMLLNPPAAPEGYYAALKDDLTWDFLPIPPEPEDERVTPEEVLRRLEEIL